MNRLRYCYFSVEQTVDSFRNEHKQELQDVQAKAETKHTSYLQQLQNEQVNMALALSIVSNIEALVLYLLVDLV